MTPSKYQLDIYEAAARGDKPIAVKAVAGAGKSHVIKEVVRAASGPRLITAFNKHIADHLKGQFTDRDVRVSTIHSMGYGALAEACSTKLKLDDEKGYKLIRAYLNDYPSTWANAGFDSAYDCVPALRELYEFARLSLVSPHAQDMFIEAASAYDLTCTPALVEALPTLLKRNAKLAEDDGQIDFTDMIHLPCRWDLQVTKYPLVFVDEVQDLNPCQLALVLKARAKGAGGMFVGDPAQSIMQFAYAGLDSFNEARIAVDAQVLPLSICYRCPTSHIKLAQELVPEIEAREDAPEGSVYGGTSRAMSALLKDQLFDSTMILCRNTAPLIATCLSLIRAGIPAHVKGRDIGRDLVTTIRAASKGNIAALDDDLTTWQHDQEERLRATQAPKGKYAALQDRVDGALAAAAGVRAASVPDLLAQIQTLFADGANGVTLSTVHRAKGLEADRVFIIRPDLLTRDTQSEANVEYVAKTRSRSILGFVEDAENL